MNIPLKTYASYESLYWLAIRNIVNEGTYTMTDNMKAFYDLLEISDEALDVIGEEEEMVKLANLCSHSPFLHFKQVFYPRLIEIISNHIQGTPHLFKAFLINDKVRSAILEECAHKFIKNHKKEQ